MKRYEMYLNYEEFDVIHKDMVERLKSFTIIACDGYWKGKHMTTILFIYIATDWDKQILFENFFKDVVQKKLGVAHYVCSDCQFELNNLKKVDMPQDQPHLWSDY